MVPSLQILRLQSCACYISSPISLQMLWSSLILDQFSICITWVSIITGPQYLYILSPFRNTAIVYNSDITWTAIDRSLTSYLSEVHFAPQSEENYGRGLFPSCSPASRPLLYRDSFLHSAVKLCHKQSNCKWSGKERKRRRRMQVYHNWKSNCRLLLSVMTIGVSGDRRRLTWGGIPRNCRPGSLRMGSTPPPLSLSFQLWKRNGKTSRPRWCFQTVPWGLNERLSLLNFQIRKLIPYNVNFYIAILERNSFPVPARQRRLSRAELLYFWFQIESLCVAISYKRIQE